MTLLFYVACPLLCGVAVAIVLLAWLRVRIKREHVRLGADLDARAKAADTTTEVLRGKLVVEGDGLERQRETDAQVGARTEWGSLQRLRFFGGLPYTTERATRLFLDTARGRVPIEGPINVELGSVLRANGRHVSIDGQPRYGMTCTVSDGDEIAILGSVREELSEEVGDTRYRDGGKGRVMAPLANVGASCVVVMAAPRRAHTVGAVARSRFTIAALLFGILPARFIAKDYARVSEGLEEACREHGGCHVDSTFRASGLGAVRLMRDGIFFRTAAHEPSDCQRSVDCMDSGKCSLVGSSCEARTDDDCRVSRWCDALAMCTATGGACALKADPDCAKRPFCNELGWCSAVNGQCRAATDADCKQAQLCRDDGHCSLENNDCVAGKDEDCAETYLCRTAGRCTARKGECTLGDKDCLSTVECRDRGQCTASSGECVATREGDCLASVECASAKRCKVRGNVCISTSLTCALSDACKVFGRCKGSDWCTAASDHDCAQSERCKTDGACKRFGDECAASCAKSEACRLTGACTLDKDRCIIGSDADCRASETCKRYGGCFLVGGVCRATDASCAASEDCKRDGLCVDGPEGCEARTDAQCQASSRCRSEGLCTAKNGHCERLGDADCARTAMCASEGKCSLGGVTGHECDWSAADCKRLPACKELGTCSRLVAGFVTGCGAEGDGDCKNSDVCARFGWCHAVHGRCVVN